MNSAKDDPSDDPAFYVHQWAKVQKIQWNNVKVKFSATDGFCLKYCPGDSISAEQEPRIAARPSSGSSVSSLQNKCPPSPASLQSAKQYEEADVLLRIPYEAILCKGFLEGWEEVEPAWAKYASRLEDNSYSGRKYAMIAFLCLSHARSMYSLREVNPSSTGSLTFGIQSPPLHPWDDYIAFLPRNPSERLESKQSTWKNEIAELTVPSVWLETEQKYLEGTSLMVPLSDKMKFLESSFKIFQGIVTETHPNLVEYITFKNWIRFDACYISRSLDTPGSGECMVPFLDMVNHSYKPNAHYVQDVDNGDIILLKYEGTFTKDEEITINYAPEHGATECLMIYGFIDPDIAFNDELVLHFSDPEFLYEDVTKREFVEKTVAFLRNGGNRRITIRQNEEGEAAWEAPFAYLLAAFEEFDWELKSYPTDRDMPGNTMPEGGWLGANQVNYVLEVHSEEDDISLDLVAYVDTIIDRNLELPALHQRAIDIITKRVNYQICKLEEAIEITDELAANPRIAMARRLRELEMGSLRAVKTELFKKARALRGSIARADTGDIITGMDEMAIEN